MLPVSAEILPSAHPLVFLLSFTYFNIARLLKWPESHVLFLPLAGLLSLPSFTLQLARPELLCRSLRSQTQTDKSCILYLSSSFNWFISGSSESWHTEYGDCTHEMRLYWLHGPWWSCSVQVNIATAGSLHLAVAWLRRKWRKLFVSDKTENRRRTQSIEI